LVNLGRLHTRDGNGTAAYQLHEALFQAAQSRDEAVIDGRRIDLGSVVQAVDDHRAIVQWLWTILLADGLRALCRAGHWSEALHQAEEHHGIGERLFDGRQIAIIAHSTTHDHTEALRLIDATATPTAWERAVAACLQVICLTRAGQPTTSAINTMIDTYLAYDADPDHALFHVRLGLTVADLAADVHDIQPVIRMIERTAINAADAYAAREILTSDLPLTEPAATTLNEIVHPSGLDTVMPPALLVNLMRAVRRSETSITRHLAPIPDRTEPKRDDAPTFDASTAIFGRPLAIAVTGHRATAPRLG